MPTIFANLPTNKPVPNGKVQFKKGASEDNVGYDGNTPANTKLLADTVGGVMDITTPIAADMLYPCIWIVRGNVMAVAYGPGAWRRWDWGINISPADADGRVVGCQVPIQLHESVSWRSSHGQCAFRLNAGTQYTASLVNRSVSNNAIAYHRGHMFHRIMGRMVSMGVM